MIFRAETHIGVYSQQMSVGLVVRCGKGKVLLNRANVLPFSFPFDGMAVTVTCASGKGRHVVAHTHTHAQGNVAASKHSSNFIWRPNLIETKWNNIHFQVGHSQTLINVTNECVSRWFELMDAVLTDAHPYTAHISWLDTSEVVFVL